MKKILFPIFFILAASAAIAAGSFSFTSGEQLRFAFNTNEVEVVHTALEIFSKDYTNVFGAEVIPVADNAPVYAGTLGLNPEAERMAPAADIEALSGLKEGFLITVQNGKLVVLGSDKRGTAYGILELSRILGVSPWEWWADSPVSQKGKVELEEGFRIMQSPSVAHRGIFLNDEDWGLTPWSYQTHEPSEIKGEIGPRTHARIFELLLRLRANTFWPAMHDCSVAFYFTPGNKEMADKYGIMVGSSHCEPMVRNTNAEWRIAGTGEYNYVTNRDNVLKFWEERVKELAGSDNIYTLGIRGVHDSKMLGANTLQEQKDVLDKVLKDQREMIAKYVNPDVEQVSQVFIPYKEVLDVYNMGLEVPEDVMLLWCDDNYGYIRHFPDTTERARKGGNGLYYHISYWGRPHDYLWLATNHPAQIYTQMKLLYEKGGRDMWIVNVGDIKPAEYLIEFFMDLAWDIDGIENNTAGLDKHLYNWLAREFGEENAGELLDIMNEYYRLAWIRKPEFMGNTRTEEKDPAYKIVTGLPWSEHYINQRISEYKALSDKVIKLSETIPDEKQDAWFQLIEYPVRGAAEMNFKHLYGQLARHGKINWEPSDSAYEMIVALTEKYNSLAGGKWNRMMDYRPRNLAVFDRVPHTTAEKPMVEHTAPLHLINGTGYNGFNGVKPVAHGLGYERAAVSIPVNTTVEYTFESDGTENIILESALVPNHPVETNTLRYSVSVDNGPVQVVDFRTEGRSEEWKMNVLRNQAIRKTEHTLQTAGNHIIRFTALDEGVILDQIKIWKK